MPNETVVNSDPTIEETFLGNVLRSPERLRGILAEVTLTETAFYLPRTRAVYREILRLTDEGVLPDATQVQSHLNGDCPSGYVVDLVANSYAVDLISYARRLVELQGWRFRRENVLKMLDAVNDRNLESYSRAKAKTDEDTVDQSSFYSPERLAAEYRKYMTSNASEAFELPFPKLNACLAGGFRRKQFTVLGGWTSHGKSIIMDQILMHIAKQRKRVHLYMNEMGHEERVARILTSLTRIPTQKLIAGDLDLREAQLVENQLDKGLPYSITPCAGWSVDELTFDIRSKDFDVIGIDIIHQFDYDSESELARISRLLTRVAKQANCHVFATVHLNEFRAHDTVKPRPVTRDIRGSGMLQRDPDNIMFIHREQDPDTGDPLMASTCYLSKVRNGSLGYQHVWFDETQMSFGRESGS